MGRGTIKETHSLVCLVRPAGRKKKALSSINSFASTTLAKAAFLCTVLLEHPECHHLTFRVGMFGLEMPRPPAMSKALEVCRRRLNRGHWSVRGFAK